MTVGIIVQTRTGSTRLPGKVMMKADDKLLMIDYVINQLKHSKLHDEIVVANTNLEQDDVIFDYSIYNILSEETITFNADTNNTYAFNILNQYNKEPIGRRRYLLNFFIGKKLNNLIETIGDF